MQAPYRGPPSYGTITRRFSFAQVDPQAYFARKRQHAAPGRGDFVGIHDVGPEQHPFPNKFDVFPDVTYETLKSKVSEELGIEYLSPATEVTEVVKVCSGYVHGVNKRPIFPLVVCYKDESRWLFFILDSESPWTYISHQASPHKMSRLTTDGILTITLGQSSVGLLR